MKYKEHRELVEGLQGLLDFIKEKGLELPIEYPNINANFWVYGKGEDDEDAKLKMAKAARAMGSARKIYSGGYLDLVKKFSSCVKLEFTVNREHVCKRVVKETKVVPAEIVPERVIPERVEEVIEWVCDEPLLASQ